MKFTDRYLQSLKPKEKDYRIRESHGFAVRVLPSGVKRFEYIYAVNGKRRILHLGNYPDTKLAEARDAFHAAASKTGKGIDPQEKPPTSPQPEILTIQSLAETWIYEWSKAHHTPKWHNTLKLALEKDILPAYGPLFVSEIRRRDAIAILETKAADAPGQANNLHKALRGMFGYALERELVDFNPFAEIRAARAIPAMKQKSRDRHLSDSEIKVLWKSIDDGGGSESTRRALKMILVTGQRPGEVCEMHYREIQYGVGESRCPLCRRCGWWTIPAERRLGNKGGEHRVFLSALAMSLIGVSQEYVFPGDELTKPISENSVAYHVRREIKSTGKIKFYGLERFTPHDLRRTVGTGVRRLGASRDAMDMILGHTVSGVTGVYDRYTGDTEKEHWLTTWSDHLMKLLN